jgi:ABC-type sugar transport system permease subunit
MKRFLNPLLAGLFFLIFAGLLALGIFFRTRDAGTAGRDIPTVGRAFSQAKDADRGITLVGTWENELKAFDAKGDPLWSFPTKGPIRDIRIDGKTGRVFAGGDDRKLYVLDLATSKQLSVIDVQRRIYSLDINADASLLAVSSGISSFKHSISLYDASGRELWKRDVGTTARAIRFVKAGAAIVYGSDRAEVTLLDLGGAVLKTVKLDALVAGIALDEKSGKLAVLTAKNSLYLMDESLTPLEERHFTGRGMSLAVSSGMDYLALGTEQGRLTIVDRVKGKTMERSYGNQISSIAIDGLDAKVATMGSSLHDLDLKGAWGDLAMGTWSRFSLIGSLVSFLAFALFALLSRASIREKAASGVRAVFKARIAYILLLPTFVLLVVFCYLPVFQAFVMAFTDWSMKTPRISFIGFDNFRLMVEEGYFLVGLKNLAIIVATSLLKTLTIPLFIAELVFAMRNSIAKQAFRFLFVVPMVVPAIVMALMWGNIYDPTIGLLNNLLNLLGLGSLSRVWLGDPATAIWAIVFMGFPFVDAFAFLIYYGGLIGIPSTLFDAAKMDGLKPLKTFWSIHVPLISSQVKMLVILSFIGSIQNFLPVLILTSGGPGTATYLPGLELYFNATRFGRYGYACALGVVMFIAILVISVINLKIKSVEEINE